VRAKILASFLDEEHRKWWTLGAVTFGLFMIMLDNTIVNVALPSIRRSLHISLSELEWVVAGYALSFAVLMLTGGKLADYYGRRRIFVIGLAIFTASSLWCGLSTGAGLLISARIVQGCGSALMNPATLSIIVATFAPRQRGMAIGIWAGVSAMALAIGPLLGGVISEHLHWGWIFFINVPVGVVGIVVARIVIVESRDTSTEQSLDLPGLAVSAAGLFGLTYGLIEAHNYGWTSDRILGAFAVAAAGLVAFLVLETRRRRPMLDLGLFRNLTFSGANTVMLLIGLAMFGVFFYVSLYIQNVLGWSPTQAGASFLPWTILIVMVAPLAGRLSDRVGARWLIAAGMTLVAGSLIVFASNGAHANFWDLLPAMLLGGFGMGITMAPTTATAMGSVPVNQAGVGSAVLNSMRQVGGSMGIAVMGAIISGYVHGPRGAPPPPAEFLHGFHHAVVAAAAVAASAAVIGAGTIRHRGHAREPVAELG
jgi:EmrB/QacA subfamily drug resistance transporter